MVLGAAKSILFESALDSILAEWENKNLDGPVVIETSNYNIIIERAELVPSGGTSEIKVAFTIKGK